MLACLSSSSLSHPNYGICSPVEGLRIRVPSLLIWLKLNIWLMELAMPSNDPPPILCPLSQLSSTKRMTEVWSVTVWSTAFSSAHGEITISGCRGPYPQRPRACGLFELMPGKDWPPVPQAPGPVRLSAVPVD
jgi:hypothetical protein